jgi:hypothetical protein
MGVHCRVGNFRVFFDFDGLAYIISIKELENREKIARVLGIDVCNTPRSPNRSPTTIGRPFSTRI